MTLDEAMTKITKLTTEAIKTKKAHDERIRDLAAEGVKLRTEYETRIIEMKSIIPPNMNELMVQFNELADKNEALAKRNVELESEVERLKAEVEKLMEDNAKSWPAFAAVDVKPPVRSTGDEDQEKALMKKH